MSNKNSFSDVISILKRELSYVTDNTFSWDDVIGILTIKLSNTDSLNKERTASHATQIVLTSERNGGDSNRITEDFFPTMTLNSTFKSWRISIPVRINQNNINKLCNKEIQTGNIWKEDHIQIRRRILNNEDGNGNPTLHICYGTDLIPIRENLKVSDYLIVVKRKSELSYEAFGLKNTPFLEDGKKMYVSSKADKDTTTFDLHGITNNDNTPRSLNAENIILYGVPGCGKSYYIKNIYCNDDSRLERVVFHPDYTYSDFVGQIMPKSDVNNHISYPFVAGPFTRILQKANKEENKDTMFFLIIEEINRGNAPAIFGDIFQLLDRDENGASTYGISNEDIAKYVYGNSETKVRIPCNLTILATMNTSDQNVFTLDTAFKRRWHMKHIANNIDSCKYSNKAICGQNITWKDFVTEINNIIADEGAGAIGYEDKRLGAYFVTENELDSSELFADKILMYLWNDVFKYNQDRIFDTKYKTLDHLITGFLKDYFKVFANSIEFNTSVNNDTVTSDNSIGEK